MVSFNCGAVAGARFRQCQRELLIAGAHIISPTYVRKTGLPVSYKVYVTMCTHNHPLYRTLCILKFLHELTFEFLG